MKPATLFREYIRLINTIHRHQRLTFEELNQHWMKTEMSGGVAMARSTFNRHRDDRRHVWHHHRLREEGRLPLLHRQCRGAHRRNHTELDALDPIGNIKNHKFALFCCRYR